MKKKVLEIKSLYKSFKRKPVLKGVNLTVFQGEIFGLVGPNGAGKTVLVDIILGLILPEKGSVKIFEAQKKGNLARF